MVVAKWFCPGDREINIKRFEDIVYINVSSFISGSVLDTLARSYIFNPEKKYSFILEDKAVQLVEDDKKTQTRTILTREIEFAREQNGEFKNIAEMYGALHIELDEVLDHIRDKSYDTPDAHYEMIQAAGILLRWVDEHGDKAEIAKRQEERHGRN